MSRQVTASELFALAHGTSCHGEDQCHWCGTPCKRLLQHDDAPRDVGIKRPVYARRPGNGFICTGCWLFGMRRVTVRYLDNDFKDRQACKDHSWYVTKQGALGVRKQCASHLYPLLLNPPYTFSLALIDDSTTNLIQHWVANDVVEVKANTTLKFTINNIAFDYTVDELEQGLRNGSEGRLAGVRELIKLFGPYKLPPLVDPEEGPKGRGRPGPKTVEQVRKDKRVIQKSGGRE